jgi:hypothetical protein
MELRTSKEWLEKHRQGDEEYNISAGSLMLKLADEHQAYVVNGVVDTVEGNRDEVTEKLKMFSREQRFRLIALPWQEDSEAHEGVTVSHAYSVRGSSRDPLLVSEGAGEYIVSSGESGESDDSRG